jgi:hypothetical protein
MPIERDDEPPRDFVTECSLAMGRDHGAFKETHDRIAAAVHLDAEAYAAHCARTMDARDAAHVEGVNDSFLFFVCSLFTLLQPRPMPEEAVMPFYAEHKDNVERLSSTSGSPETAVEYTLKFLDMWFGFTD